MSFVCNLLIRAVTEDHTWLTSLTFSPLRLSSVHVHVFCHELNLRFRNLLDDITMFDLGNRVDAHDRTFSILSTRCSSGLVVCICTCCVLLRATSWMTSHVFGDWSFHRLLAEGSELIGWRKVRPHGKYHASFRLRDHLRSATVSVSSMSSWAKASRTSKCQERDQDLFLVCRSRVLVGSCRRVRPSWNDTRVSRSPIVVELTLPILAHKPYAVLHKPDAAG